MIVFIAGGQRAVKTLKELIMPNKVFLSRPMAITEAGLNDVLQARTTSADISIPPVVDNQHNKKIGVLRISGPIFSASNFLTRLLGFQSIEDISAGLQALLADEEIGSIVLRIDSPGGDVTGVSELSSVIYNARGVKPIRAHIAGTGASAAYWLASAADSISIDPTGQAGSIGVVYGTVRKPDDRIEIVSSYSPRKRLDPESNDGQSDILTRIDAIAEVMIADIARNRGVSTDHVIENYGQGGLFVGKAAVDAGLIDTVSGYSEQISRIGRESPTGVYGPSVGGGPVGGDHKPAAIAQPKAVDRAVIDMAEAVLGPEAVAKLKTAMDTGVTVEQYKLLAGFRKPKAPKPPVRDTAKRMLAALQADLTAAPGYQPPDFMTAVGMIAKRDGVGRGTATRAAVGEFPRLHAEYVKGLKQTDTVS